MSYIQQRQSHLVLLALNRKWEGPPLRQFSPEKLDNSLESRVDESALQARVNICALDVSITALVRRQQSQQHLS